MAAIPLMVDLKGKTVVVIGGGRIAERRIRSLIESEAALIVVSPELAPNLRSLFNKGTITWKQKKFTSDDLEEAVLIVAATDDQIVNQAIIESAPPHAFVNAAGNMEQGNILFPSYFKRGKLSIGISTNGASPLFAAQVKNQLESIYDDKYEDYLDFLFEARQLLKRSSLQKEEKQKLLHQLLSEDFLDTNKQTEILNCIRKN
jgi:precorrin-2 dehydrogenase/sirohydrochlorin ferrochelatase